MNREDIQRIGTQRHVIDKLLNCKGAFAVCVEHKTVKGVETDKFAISVYVSKKLPKEELSADDLAPEEIEGAPTDVKEYTKWWPSKESHEEMAARSYDKLSQADILVGGLSISNQHNLTSFGTLGIVLLSNNTPTALSCAHVMVQPPLKPGQAVVEPGGPKGGTYPADSIGTVSNFSYGEHNADAALVPIQGRAAKVGEVQNIGKIVGWGDAVVGQRVKKMGVTTGLTYGVITSVTFNFTQRDHILGTVKLTNQIKVKNIGGQDFALPGDSGAAVVDDNQHIVGIVIGGTPGEFTACSPSAHLKSIAPSAMTF